MRKFFTKKRIIWAIIILLILGAIGYFVFGHKSPNNNIQTDTVKRQNLTATVLATGQVVSGINLNLSFDIINTPKKPISDISNIKIL